MSANPAVYTQRLVQDRVTALEFERLLDEPIESLRDRFPAPPSWLTDLVQTFSQAEFFEPLPFTERLASHPLSGLLNAVQPLLMNGIELSRQGIAELVAKYTTPPFDPAT